MAAVERIKGRYELKENIGQGGMGVVYRAFDTEVGREVALKTIGDVSSRAALDLFYKEWRVLANLHHPNIVEIFDIGEFQEGSVIKPFFVMPLLRGTTLDQIIRVPGQTIAPDRLVEIMSQLCRGLHAAHEHGLVHRDLKPSNVFVMEYDSVKLIDFGVAHLVGGASRTGLKGTLWYMAPEQIQNQECTPAVDIFSLGVLCYEALTGVRPFHGGNAEEVFDAILHRIPLPASEINPQISQPISRVLHKAMAKHPRHRFSSALQFAETLQKAYRNEYIEFFDPANVQPRIQRAVRAYETGNFQLASDILSDVEAAGYIDPALTPLRKQIDLALRRKTIGELIEGARSGIAEEEYTLANEKVEQLLKIDPTHQEGLRLKAVVDQNLGQKQVDDWLRTSITCINTHQYDRARQLLQKIIQKAPDHSRAAELLNQLEVREQAYRKARHEKESMYQAARDSWDNCEFESAFIKLKRVLELEEQAPDTSAPESRSNYLGFFSMVESAHQAVEASVAEYYRALQRRDFEKAEQICNENAGRYPGHPLFEGLRMNLEEARAYYTAEMMSTYRKRALEEADYDMRMNILREANERFPHEQYFEASLQRLRERAAFAKTTIAKARLHEQQGRFAEARERWRILKRTDPKYPGVDHEIERLSGNAELMHDAAHPARPPLAAAAATGAAPSFLTGSSSASAAAPAQAPAGSPAPTQIGGNSMGSVFVPSSFSAEPKAAPAQKQPAAAEGVKPAAPAEPRMAGVKRTFAQAGNLGRDLWTGVKSKLSKSPGAPPPAQKSATRKALPWAIPAAILVVVIGVVGVVLTRISRTPSKPTSTVAAVASAVPVTVESATKGATIFIDKVAKGTAEPSLKLDLPPGHYEIQASLPGHKDWSDTLVVTASNPASVSVPALAVLPQTYRVITDFNKGQVWLDGKPQGPIKDSQFALEDLSPGKHVIGVNDGTSATVTFAFEVGSGSAPVVTNISRPGLAAVIVSGSGDNSRLYTNVANAKYSVDKGSGSDIPADGVQISGSHDVSVGDLAKDPFLVHVENSPAPSLTARLYSDRNVGTLVVTAPSVSSFKVLLDGKEVPARIRDGKISIPGVPAKAWTLTVRSDGFEDHEEKITIKKGQELPVVASLKQIPQVATLKIDGAPPEAQVFIDNSQVGTTGADGAFTTASVAPGEHQIVFRKSAYKEKTIQKNFKPRSTVTLSAADIAMEKLPATVNVTVAAGAKAIYKCSDGAEHELTDKSVSCKEGPAVFKATRAGFDDDVFEKTLNAGGTYNVTLSPKQHAEATRTRTTASCGREQLSNSGWQVAGGVYELKGAAEFPCAGKAGVYDFTLVPPKGGVFSQKKITWTIPKAVIFSLDKKSISGPKGKEDLKNITQSDGSVALRIEISSNRVVQSVKTADGGWQVLGAVDQPNGAALSAPVRFRGDASMANFSFKEQP